MTSCLLGLLLFSWTLQLGGGQSVTHTGPPIVVALANKSISFGCKISYLYTSEYKIFKVGYFYVDRQSKTSATKRIDFHPSQGIENQTHVVTCPVTPPLWNASATGTYYCSVQWKHVTKTGKGTFILVRDSGYREPPWDPQELLLFGFTGLLTLLSVLGTALLLWKKKPKQVPGKQTARKCQDPRSTSNSNQPPSESVYTDLQRHESEVYAYIESEANSPPSLSRPYSQEGLHQCEDEFGQVYENL